MVFGEDGRKYMLVALIDDPNGEKILRDLIPLIEKIIQ